MKRHVAVWIDHKVARVFAVDPEQPDDARRFFHEVARALDGADAVLVVGPSTAKLELLRYVHRHEHALEAAVVGVETVDHPTDKQLVAYARTYFKRNDAMRIPSAP